MRLCRCGCKIDLDEAGLRADALYASQACKMRHRRAKANEEASASPSRNKGVTRRRSPTRYALIPADRLQQLLGDADLVEAHDRAAAARQGEGDVVAIPARSLPL